MPQEFSANLDSINAYVQRQGFKTQADIIDFVREYVNRNSIHRIDAEHEAYAFNTPRVVSMLFEHDRGDGAPPPICPVAQEPSR